MNKKLIGITITVLLFILIPILYYSINLQSQTVNPYETKSKCKDIVENNFNLDQARIKKNNEDNTYLPSYVRNIKFRQPRYIFDPKDKSCIFEFQYAEFRTNTNNHKLNPILSTTQTVIVKAPNNTIGEISWLRNVGFYAEINGTAISDYDDSGKIIFTKTSGVIESFQQLEKDIFGNSNYIPRFDQFQES